MSMVSARHEAELLIDDGTGGPLDGHPHQKILQVKEGAADARRAPRIDKLKFLPRPGMASDNQSDQWSTRAVWPASPTIRLTESE